MHFWSMLLVIWFHLVHCYAVPISSTSTATTSTVTPLVIPASQLWDGNDGPWSSFDLRIGSPPQTIRVLVSTSSNQPLVLLPATCDSNSTDCANDHGGVFQSNKSTTWTSNNVTYAVALDSDIGIIPAVRYGYDSVAISCLGSGTPTLASQPVGELTSTDLFTGFLGLNPSATNFSNGEAEVASYMSNLKAQNQIPSLSYGYNAGSIYRGSNALASLILGGYDTSLFKPNNLTFAFNTQSSRDLTVYIKSISKESMTGNGTLLSSAIPAFIDTTTPYIWLPVEVCKQFELQFGIKYDDVSGLYLINDTLHDSLLAQNANVTFTLGNKTSLEEVDIILPYAAFDLIASSPLVSTPSRYFPLKRANTASQITLGRTFFQEAYLITDYERSKFSVSQMEWHFNAASTVVTIMPVSGFPNSTANTTIPAPQTKRSIPTTTIVAATVSGSAFVLILVVSVILIRLRQKKLDIMMKVKIKSPPSPPTPAMTFAPIIHEENCPHCRTQTPPSPEPIQGGFRNGSQGSIHSGQTSSLGHNDNRREITQIPGGLSPAPLPVPPTSPSSEGATSQESLRNQNTQVSPLTPGPAIPPRFSSLDRAAIPSTLDIQPNQVPSVKSGIYELSAREEVGLNLEATTPIEAMLQAALDQVITSHQQVYEDHLKSPSRGGYLPVSPSTRPPEEEERRRVDSLGYNGESSRSGLPSTPRSRPMPVRNAGSISPTGRQIPTYQPQPPHSKPENVPDPRVRQLTTPTSRFSPQSQDTQVSSTKRKSSQSGTFDKQPTLRIFPSPPRAQPQIQNLHDPPPSRFHSPPRSYQTSISHQRAELPPNPPEFSHLAPKQPERAEMQERSQASRIMKPSPSPSSSHTPNSSSSPSSDHNNLHPQRRTCSNSPPNRKRHSRLYPPPSSLPPDCPLPSLPSLEPSFQYSGSMHDHSSSDHLDSSQNQTLARSRSLIQPRSQTYSRPRPNRNPDPQPQNPPPSPSTSSSPSPSRLDARRHARIVDTRRRGTIIEEEDEEEEDTDTYAEEQRERERQREIREIRERRERERGEEIEERGARVVRDVRTRGTREYSWLRLDF